MIELLVVIAIIGILIALLLPVVQAARESARRVTCANNMRQVGVAIMHFEESKRVLPIGCWPGDYNLTDPGGTHGQLGHTVYVSLLPQLEQQVLFNLYRFGRWR